MEMSQTRTAIVTGAGGGLGGAATEALADAGLNVTAVDINNDAAARIKKTRPELAERILTLGGDIRSANFCADIVTQTIEKFGAVQILVNNAGIGQATIREDYYAKNIMFWEVPDERWDVIIDTNVKAAFMMAKAVVPHMLSAGWGRIVNVTTSMDTMIRRGWTPYGPSKAALEACSAIWAKDLDGSGVSVNIVVPGGPVNTGMVPTASAPDRGSLLQPDVMKPPITWLSSDASDGFTGRRIVAADWNNSLPGMESAQKASWPTAWPGLGAQAIVAGGNPMEGS